VCAAFGSAEHGNESLCQRLASCSDFWPCANFTWHIYFLSFWSTAAYKTVWCVLHNTQLLIKSLVYTLQHTAAHKKKYGLYYVIYTCL